LFAEGRKNEIAALVRPSFERLTMLATTVMLSFISFTGRFFKIFAIGFCKLMCHVDFEPVGRRGNCPSGKSLLDAARELGVGLAVTCDGRGSCHACRVQVVEGHTSPPAESELNFFSKAEIEKGWRLACQCCPLDECKVFIPPESMTTEQRMQVEGIEVSATPQPAVKYYRVNLTPPSLSDLIADADRLIAALNREYNLQCDSIDLSVLLTISPLLRSLNWECRAAVRGNEVIEISPASTRPVGLAVDMGTTKVAGYLIDLTTGETITRRAEMNPQISYGEDIVSRLTRAVGSPDEAEKLRELAVESVNRLASELTESAGLKAGDILDAVIVGNTAIHHLLLGLPVKQLTTAPYIAAVREAIDVKARDMKLEFARGAYVHIPANIAGYVGADHTADLLAVDALRIKDTVILIDIGTNTEISLIHNGVITSVSCASGPAFEGGHIRYGMRAASGAIERLRMENGKIEFQTVDNTAPNGICGSGVLDGLASFFSNGVIDKGGRMAEGKTTINTESGQREFVISDAGRKISLTQGDVRELQLAKSAIRTGIQILLEAGGLTDNDIDRIIIAGAFGTYIDVESAVTTGMLPTLLRERFSQIGNAAGMGAKLALISTEKRAEAKEIARKAHYIELATAPFFMLTFTQACFLGKYRLNHGKREKLE
jgi:uncharacterized 2Fe-2S/4Fe-4S cluster protein (DUF4445 family)